jgi:hypothetical protein
MTGSVARAFGGRTTHAHVADVGGHGGPAVIHGQLVDRRALQLVEHGACLGRAQFVQERRPDGRLDERL